MDGWQQDWMKALESVTNEIGQFFQDLGKDMSEATDAFIEFIDEVAEDVEQSITPSLDEFETQMAAWMEPFLYLFTGLEDTLDRAIDQAVEPVSYTVEPLLNQHAICVGCRHYHGRTYNGVMFVCAMHPYGIVDGSESCPDKETVSWMLPPSDFSDSDDRF